MGLLPNDYYTKMTQKSQGVPSTQNNTMPQNQTETQPSPVSTQPVQKIVPQQQQQSLPSISEEDQIKKFGGVVGSPQYYETKAKQFEQPSGFDILGIHVPGVNYSALPQFAKSLASVVGINIPDDETWDKLPLPDKITYVSESARKSAVKMVTSLPAEVIKAPVRFGISSYQAWSKLAKGEVVGTGSEAISSVAEKNSVVLPLLGEVSSYWKSYDDAIKSGVGPLAATLLTSGTALGDMAVGFSLAEGVQSAFKPKTAIKQGAIISDTQPIKNAIIDDVSAGKKMLVRKGNSASEYYSIPRTVAKERFGTNPSNTYVKITPATADSVEVSVVEVRSGGIQRIVDYTKSKFKSPTDLQSGDFGPEVRLQSQIVPILKKNKSKMGSVLTEEDLQKTITSIPPKPLKGFENRSITDGDINNLDLVSKVNGIDSEVQSAVIRTLTGKKAVGELNQAEYVNVVQALGRMGKANQIQQTLPTPNIFSQYASPQRRWMRSYEENTGLPIYSEVYVPIEDAVRVRNLFRDNYRNEARQIFGEYAGPQFAEERRLISKYLEGDKSSILDNPKLDVAVKKDLVSIADQTRALYEKIGPILDVEPEAFLKNYQPHIQSIGGVHQLYKEGSVIPEELNFFAKFKRHGSTNVNIDDALALFDIYTNAGSNAKFLNPVLQRIGKFGKDIPNTLQSSVKSYIFEKMGYAGKFEEFLDSVGGKIGSKLGIDVPPDIARQLTQVIMDTTYSGALSRPGSVFRNLIQYDLLTYPRLGPKFYSEAAKTALTKEGIKEVLDKGFLVNLGVPYGEELAQEITILGKVGSTYQRATQATLSPYSMADTVNRARTYWQTKYIFNDALAKYNSKKINWNQFEKEIDLNSFSPVDRNIIRNRLISGDSEGAFNHIVRDVLDDTQFPYRKGASSRITYGLTGKMGTQFGQWTIEFSHTMGSWIKNKQWDKLIRFAGASTIIQRTLSNSFGFDFRNDVYTGPFNPSFSPFVQTGISLMDGIQAIKNNNAEELNASKDEIVRSLKSLGRPAGIQLSSFSSFLESYGKGVDSNGQYGVYDQRGRLKYRTDFNDLFWTMMGFPTNQKVAQQSLVNEMTSASFNSARAKQKALELYQTENFDKANELISRYGINLSPSDFDQYYIPLNQRVYNALPAKLKAQFAPRVFQTQSLPK